MLVVQPETKVKCSNCQSHIATTKEAIVIGRDQIKASMFYPDEGQFSENKSSVCKQCGLSWLPTMYFLAIPTGQKPRHD